MAESEASPSVSPTLLRVREVTYEKNKKFKPIKVNKQTGQAAIMFVPVPA